MLFSWEGHGMDNLAIARSFSHDGSEKMVWQLEGHYTTMVAKWMIWQLPNCYFKMDLKWSIWRSLSCY
jgi:hypothetical protein